MLTVGSLFTGIGGFDLGLERAGMRILWQAESDEFCRRVLARHWPGVPCYSDVRDLVADASGGGRREGSRQLGGIRAAQCSTGQGAMPMPVPHVDVLCGGFPCQDISVAGRGAGIDGARSGLWAEYARLVGELRPAYVIVENVPALLARGLGRVLSDLAALGYDAEWDCLPASAFGAPHRRDRIWLVAYPGRSGRRQDPGGAPGDEGPDEGWPAQDDHVAGGDGSRRPAAGADPDLDRRGLQIVGEPAQLGTQNARRDEPNRLRATGPVADAEVVAERPGLCTSRPEAQWRRRSGDSGCANDSDPDSARLAQRQGVTADDDAQLAAPVGTGWWAAEPDVGRVAHGIPNRVDRLRALGNSLVPQVAEWIGRRIIEWERG